MPVRRFLPVWARRSILVGALLGLAACTVAGALSAQATIVQAPPRVTIIGDSVASSLDYVPAARAILAAGIDLKLELAPCRRVGQASCPYLGSRPPTVLDLVPTLGNALGQTVIVAVGYNDFEQAYAGDMEDALAALRKVGVQHVLWLTLHEVRPDYAAMNVSIHAAATHHPELTVVDWQAAARAHPAWFQPEGIHLTAAGAIAMATLVHDKLVTLGIPLPPPTIATERLPDATVAHRYDVALNAHGGVPPRRWKLMAGRLPRGLRLLANGRVVGVPRRVGTFSMTVQVTDAQQTSATRRVSLLVRPHSS
jgi:hypothetical protein